MLQPESNRVKVSVISFAQQPKLEFSFKDSQDRETIFEKVEAINLLGGEAAYAKAVDFAIRFVYLYFIIFTCFVYPS